MEVKAKLRFLRMSPKKVRLVVDLIRGMNVNDAIHQLQFNPKAASNPLLKLLNSAIANAENNFKLDNNNLFIKKITVDQGPTLHRWKPRAFGRATEIRKRSSHIIIVLDEIVPSKKVKAKEDKKEIKTETVVKSKVAEVEKPKENVGEDQKEAVIDEQHKPEVFDVRRKGKHRHTEHLDKKEMKKPQKKKGFLKKMFKRKSV